VLRLPNQLTIIRLFLSPIFICVFLLQQWWAALGLALVFEATDLLDGYFARRYKMVSSLGKLIDPLADSVSRFSVFLAFTTEPTVREDPWPVLLVAGIFYRDTIVAYIRTFAASTGTVLSARFSGKLKAVFQGTGIIFFLVLRSLAPTFPEIHRWLPWIFYAIMLPVVLVTVFSGVDYLAANWSSIVAMATSDRDKGSDENA